MKRNILYKTIIAVSIGFCLFTACKKNYITGGSAENVDTYKNMTTYDVLNGNAQFDTLVQLINAANLKDKINEQGVTFFAPANHSVYTYLNDRTLLDQAIFSQDAQFGLDSLIYYLKNNINHTADSLLMYLIPQPLTYSVLTGTGTLYPTELQGDTAIVSYEYTKDPAVYYNPNSPNTYDPIVSSVPQVVYFTQLWYHYNLSGSSPANAITAQTGVHTLCKTSGVVTQTGIMNTLENSHVLFFYGTKQ